MKYMTMLFACSLLLSNPVLSQVNDNIVFSLDVVKNGELISSSRQVIPINESVPLINTKTTPFIKSITIHNENGIKEEIIDMSTIKTGYTIHIKPSVIGKVIVLDVKGRISNLIELKNMEGGVEEPIIDEGMVGKSFALLDGETRLLHIGKGSESAMLQFSAKINQKI